MVEAVLSFGFGLAYLAALVGSLPAALGRTSRTTVAGVAFACMALLIVVQTAVFLVSGVFGSPSWYFRFTSIAWNLQFLTTYALLAALLIEPIRDRLGLPTQG